jgi:flagellar biogenesis protein FliO
VEIARQVLSVLAVFALLGGALWALRRGGSASFGRWPRAKKRVKSIESLERLALTPQHSLHLVRIEGRELVVATHPQGCVLLTDTDRVTGAHR